MVRKTGELYIGDTVELFHRTIETKKSSSKTSIVATSYGYAVIKDFSYRNRWEATVEMDGFVTTTWNPSQMVLVKEAETQLIQDIENFLFEHLNSSKQ